MNAGQTEYTDKMVAHMGGEPQLKKGYQVHVYSKLSSYNLFILVGAIIGWHFRLL